MKTNKVSNLALFSLLAISIFLLLHIVAGNPGEILITDFKNLYVNSFGLLQASNDLNVYEKLADGGVRFNFKPGSNWYTVVSDYTKNYCLSGEGGIVRITGADFRKNGISFNFYPATPKNGRCDAGVQEQPYAKFFSGTLVQIDQVSGREYMDFDLDTFQQNLSKLFLIAFDFNVNVNITIYSISIYYKQSSLSSHTSYSSNPLTSTITLNSTPSNLDTDLNSANTILMIAIGAGVASGILCKMPG